MPHILTDYTSLDIFLRNVTPTLPKEARVDTTNADKIIQPYKIQVFIPENLRKSLKRLAREEDTSLQNLVFTLLSVATDEAASAIRPAMRKRLAKMS